MEHWLFGCYFGFHVIQSAKVPTVSRNQLGISSQLAEQKGLFEVYELKKKLLKPANEILIGFPSCVCNSSCFLFFYCVQKLARENLHSAGSDENIAVYKSDNINKTIYLEKKNKN